MKAANDNQRLLSRAEAATYCGYSPEHFSRLVLQGVFPPALPRIKRWDKAAIDNKLNELSGLTVEAAAQPKEDFDSWERRYRESKAKRAAEGSQKTRGR